MKKITIWFVSSSTTVACMHVRETELNRMYNERKSETVMDI